jgi:pimeloyl-ACP methyl ester carboxylesterase
MVSMMDILSGAAPLIVDVRQTGASPDVVDPDYLDVLVDEALQVPARVWRAMFAALLQYDDTDRLARIDVPTLLLWGDHDPLVAHDSQIALCEQIPDATLLVYEGVGHTPRCEHPRRFASDVAAFVAARA